MATNQANAGSDDSSKQPGCKIRVTFFESERPLTVADSDLPEIDAETAANFNLARQFSAESGQDNPFRPDGDLSREADEIVQLIKRGKSVVPADEPDSKARDQDCSAAEAAAVAKTAAPQLAAQSPGSNGSAAKLVQAEVQHAVVASPSDPATVEHVHIKKDKGCCLIQ